MASIRGAQGWRGGLERVYNSVRKDSEECKWVCKKCSVGSRDCERVCKRCDSGKVREGVQEV